MRHFGLICFVIGWICIATLPVVDVGCGSPTAKTTQVAGSVSITVDAAMKSWGAWVRAGRATEEQRLRVRGAYQKYQAAMLTAEKVATTALTQPDGQNMYTTALNVAAQSSLELIALIESLTK